VRLRFGLGVRLDDAMALECDAVAGVGIGEDGRDVGYGLLGQPVERDGAVDAFVSDVMRNNATLSPAISSPYDCALPFF
jgi:hypothetical protein